MSAPDGGVATEPKTGEDLVDLTVISPVFNEAENVLSSVSRIVEALKAMQGTWELLLVNDGSSDDTLAIARDLEGSTPQLRVLSYPVNCGRGRALRHGFTHARGRYVITIDFDLSYSEDHILALYRELSDPRQMNDVVLGSAYMVGGKVVGVDSTRLLVSRLGNKILEYTFPQAFKTTTCILRGYRREVLQALELDSDGKEIHLEILSKVCALGFRVKEIPATLSSRKKGTSKFHFRKTSLTHLLFAIFERPIVLFGAAGLILVSAGLLIGCYIIWLRYSGTLNPGRPLIPLMIILLIMGTQFFCFAFIASQNNYLRNQVYRLQRQINMLKDNKE
jgi:glycosyltransferase involved in cell wall biosynthesis